MPVSESAQVPDRSNPSMRILLCAGLIVALHLPSMGAQAACVFVPGPAASAGEDVVTCDDSGSDPAGINTLGGNDSLNLLFGSAVNGLVDMGTGVATVTNAGTIDSAEEAILISGSGTLNNTATGVINFGDSIGFGRGGIIFNGQSSIAAVDVDNNGRIEGDGNTNTLSGVRVRDFTSGSITINNNAGAVLSVGEPGVSNVVGSDDPVGAIIIEDVGTAVVAVANDGSINLNTTLSYISANTNAWGVTIQDADGTTVSNNGSINVAANLQETNVFGIVLSDGSNSSITNAGSISVAGTSTYTGVPAVEEPDIVGMVSLFEAGDITVANTAGATIDVLSDASSSIGVVGGMAATFCTDGTGCLGSALTNAGGINVTVNNGTNSLGAGVVAGVDFDGLTIDNSGSIAVTNNAAGSSFVAGMFTFGITNPEYTNSGSISVQDMTGNTAAAGILMQGVSGPTVNNSATGVIAAAGALSNGMVIAQSGSDSALLGANVINAGSISGNTGIVINGSSTLSAAINTYFENTGSITGSGGVAIDAATDIGILTDDMDNPVASGATVETVENSGSIVGDINLGPGTDAFLQSSSSAVTSGAIDLGPGDDLATWSGGSVQGISGNDGSDSVTVSSSSYDGTQVLDGGDDASTGDGWIDVLTVQGATITTAGANLNNWESIILNNSVLNVSDNALTVGADPGTGLSLANGGALSLQDGTPADAFSLNGNFSGGGLLLLDTALGGSGSPTDTVSISGDASGVTIVNIANVGGPGSATTGNGILIVRVAGASAAGAFTLAGAELRSGEYVYSLAQVGKDWYLQSNLAPSGPGPGPGPGPFPEEGSAQSIPTMTSYTIFLLVMLLLLAGARGFRVKTTVQ